jgi:opacity protein-like surface antigen
MSRRLSLAALFAIVAGAPALAQGAAVYDQNNSFGLSNAGVQPGPYLKLDGGYSFPTTHNFANTPVVGGGIGWRFTPFFRMDATFDDRYDSNSRLAGAAKLRDYAAMLNGYVDLNVPFLRPLIPYLGFGAGFAQNKVGGSTVTVSGTTPANLTGSSRNQFAWQGMAGVSWYLAPNLALDVSYRYFYGGRAESGVSSGFPVRGDYRAQEVVGAVRFGF